jgi:hypothetical protein
VGSIPFWADDPASWDTCILGGEILPGIAVVEFEKSRDVDKKKSKGSDGITLTDNGAEAAPGEISITIWTAEHWDEWQRMRPKFDPAKAGGIKSPLTIVHPMAADAGIDVVYIESLKAKQPRKAGSMTITMSVVQWFPQPKPTVSKKEPDIEARRYQDPGGIPLDAVEGLDGLRNPDGTVMDLGEGATASMADDALPETASGPSMFDKFGFGSKEPGTATG